jgi:hypothetical protein
VVASKVEKNAYQPWWTTTELTIYGAAAAPKEVRLGDQVLRDWRYDSQTHSVTLTVTDALKNWSVSLTF